MGEHLISIGAAAARVAVSPWKLRSWEQAGLLSPVRSAGNYRLYREADVEAAMRIKADEESGHRARLVPLEVLPQPQRMDQGSPRKGTEGESDTGSTDSRPLRRMAHTIGHVEDDAAVLQAVLDSGLEIVHTGIGTISYADMIQQRYVLVASRGLSDEYVRGIETWKLHEGLAGQSFGLREPLAIEDLSADPGVARDIVHKEKLRGYACLPLMRGQRRLGILEVFSSRPRRFGLDDLAPLEVVGATAAALIESFLLKRDFQQLRSERYRVISDWSVQAADEANRDLGRFAEAIRAEALLLADGSAAVDLPGMAGRLKGLALEMERGIKAGIDVLPSIRDQLVPRLSARTGKEIAIRIDDWPASIPIDLAPRLVHVVDALAAPAAAAAESSALLVFGQRDGSLCIEVHDDREAPSGLDRLATVAGDARLSVRGLDGFIERAAEAGWSCGVRAVIPHASAGARLDALTPRERQVLEAMELGQPNRELAAGLGMSAKTLQNHLTSIYKKLGVTSRGQAMRIAAGS
ncbi:LuxR C-terminal-related transcriptional regulator [Arthrobacter mangrovi]|uniref:MerR family transcriptional regulator n=1 Tax=Arthrobacter mangrovi TaxID=2966350 RepID=A0ABQ5MYU0_9MICC|nr:GAF domain-containing protein [Arthrobacter mangrovi]GLB69116.1 hypothetical protein AHIS1636_35590 [Arthrobacter mangrovi]